jgi:hypothetical protein
MRIKEALMGEQHTGSEHTIERHQERAADAPGIRGAGQDAEER